MTDQERRTQRWLDGGLSGGAMKTPNVSEQAEVSLEWARRLAGSLARVASISFIVPRTRIESTGSCIVSHRPSDLYPTATVPTTDGWEVIRPSDETAGWAITRSGRVYAVTIGGEERSPNQLHAVGVITHPFADDPESRIFPGGTTQSELALHGSSQEVLAQAALLNGVKALN